jgi:hypothetical protein
MAKSVTDMAVESIDRDIADLMRAKSILLSVGIAAEVTAEKPKAKRTRGPNKKKGLPVAPNPDDEAARF